ncbi:hypothetical protein F4861DRAFT_496169 [Xylaria intraflava]|nr:hypothetical protein F4861DRAFT_496169 [Xylaria intraflava]
MWSTYSGYPSYPTRRSLSLSLLVRLSVAVWIRDKHVDAQMHMARRTCLVYLHIPRVDRLARPPDLSRDTRRCRLPIYTANLVGRYSVY